MKPFIRQILFLMVLLSNFLTVDCAIAQPAPSPAAVPLVTLEKPTGTTMTAQQMAAVQEAMKNLQSSNKPKYKGFTMSKGGSIQGGGGGAFTAATFWLYVRSIKLIMNDQSFTKILTEEQRAEVFRLMDPEVTKVAISPTQLYVENAEGKDDPVDAVNVPDENLIILYKKSWDDFLASKMEMRHLVLHEFLGLAKINDDGYRISMRYIVPVQKVIPYADLSKAKCESRGYVLTREADDHLIQSISFKTKELIFSPSEKTGKVSTYCADLKDRSSHCFYRDLTRNFKKIRVVEKLEVTQTPGSPQASTPEFSMKIDVLLGDGYQNYGYGGASDKTFPHNPDIQLVTQLIVKDAKSGLPHVLAVDTHLQFEPDEYGDLKLMTTMINPQFAEMFLRAGINFQNASRTGPGEPIMGIQNLSDLMWDYARSHGAKDTASGGKFLEKQLFKNMPMVTPIYLQVHCTIK